MTRVSEKSSVDAINYAVGKTKSQVEDLQMKGSTLKRITKPSDDPVGNVELLAIRSQNIDATQYVRNLNFASTQLAFTENILEDVTDILSKAKELAVGQASSIYGPEIRAGVSKEIHQLRQQMLSLANKRMGNRYLFSGQKILTPPFDKEGKYHGDHNKINIEINKDVYIPVNLTGKEIFFSKTGKDKPTDRSQLDLASDPGLEPVPVNRGPANLGEGHGDGEEVEVSMFDELRALENALLTDNPQIIQGLLERLDESIDRVVAARTAVGALTNTLSNTETNIEKTKLLNEAHKSKLEDADVTVLFSDLQKQQNVLQASYKASSHLMNNSLMDFLK
ncbi:MAG TPA: flagellar hook-associated protein FlgL [Bacteriovoracaceae bacterium]|nr:flagellar hook-associated protein FlgL [Bacteriovoracaceae bacterium]